MRKLMLLATALLISAFSATAQQVNDDSGYPTIQDTFFGMKMGSTQSFSRLKSALWHKGEFLRKKYILSGSIAYTFTKVPFAGRTWDYCELSLSNKNELYEVCVYDSLDDCSDDAKKEAGDLYRTFKNKLLVKYGIRNEVASDDDLYVFYSGENWIFLTLYNRRNESEGGAYRRYVGLDYTQQQIYGRLQEANDNEL